MDGVSPEVARAFADRCLAARAQCNEAIDESLAMVAGHIPCGNPVSPECSTLTMAPGANPYCPICGWTIPTPKETT